MAALGLNQMAGGGYQLVKIAGNKILLINIREGFKVGNDCSDTLGPTDRLLQQSAKII